MHSVNIERSLLDDILVFCQANEINDVDGFINETLKKGFDMKKYGDTFAFIFNKRESDMVHVGKEVQVEVPKEEPTKEPVSEVLEPKKRGRKKKVEEPVVEVKPEPVVEKDPEPTYIIKQEEKPVKKAVTLYKKDDNYDVYDI